MELEAKEEKGQSPFLAPETHTSLASGQSSPGHKLSVTPVPLNPGFVNPSHAGQSTPSLPDPNDQGKALADPEHKRLCQGQEQKCQAASAWAKRPCVPGGSASFVSYP